MAYTIGLVRVGYKGTTRAKRKDETGNKSIGYSMCRLPSCPNNGLIEVGSPCISIPFVGTYTITDNDDKEQVNREVDFRSARYFHIQCFADYALYMCEHRKDYQKKRGPKPLSITDEQKHRRNTLMVYITRNKNRLLQAYLAKSDSRIKSALHSLVIPNTELNSTVPYKFNFTRPPGLIAQIGLYFGQDNTTSLGDLTIEDIYQQTLSKES